MLASGQLHLTMTILSVPTWAQGHAPRPKSSACEYQPENLTVRQSVELALYLGSLVYNND